MAEMTWTLQDAKNQFSRVVAAAQRGRPQFVSKRGRSAVVVLSVEEYQRLAAARNEPTKSFVEHLLSIPKRPPSIPDDEELFPREPFRDRGSEFEE
jgi:prevent-host-death family protein